MVMETSSEILFSNFCVYSPLLTQYWVNQLTLQNDILRPCSVMQNKHENVRFCSTLRVVGDT